MKESALLNVVIRELHRAAVGHFVRQNVAAFRIRDARTGDRFLRCGVKGQADLWGVVHGWHVEIEVKTPKGRQSESQAAWEEKIRSHGGLYFICDRVDRLDRIDPRTGPRKTKLGRYSIEEIIAILRGLPQRERMDGWETHSQR